MVDHLSDYEAYLVDERRHRLLRLADSIEHDLMTNADLHAAVRFSARERAKRFRLEATQLIVDTITETM